MPEDQMPIPEVAEAAANPLNVLLALFEKLKEHSSKQAEAQAIVDAETKRIEQLETRDIPDMMADLGLSEFTTRDGTTIKVTDQYFGSVSKERMPQAIEWLKEHNMAGIAKEKIIFDRVDQELKDDLGEAGILFTETFEIPPATLKSFIKERVLAESDPQNTIQFPRELFAVSVVPKASLVKRR